MNIYIYILYVYVQYTHVSSFPRNRLVGLPPHHQTWNPTRAVEKPCRRNLVGGFNPAEKADFQ